MISRQQVIEVDQVGAVDEGGPTQFGIVEAIGEAGPYPPGAGLDVSYGCREFAEGAVSRSDLDVQDLVETAGQRTVPVDCFKSVARLQAFLLFGRVAKQD